MNDYIKNVVAKIRTAPWVLIVIIAMVAGVFFPIFPDGVGGHTTLTGYVLTWLGSVFKSMSAAVIGFWFCRHVLRVNLSEITDPLARGVTGLGCCVVIMAFVIGVNI